MNTLRIFITLLFVPCVGLFAQSDREGCKDHPLVTRYPASVIGWCDLEEYQEYHIAIGPQTGYRYIEEWLDVAGKVTRIYYEYQGDRTVTEIYYNYLQAAQKAGMEILAQGLNPKANVGKEVGGRTWINTAYTANPLPSSEGLNLFHGTSTSGGAGYFAGKLSRPTGTVYLTIMAYQHSQNEVLVQVDIIEAGEMEGDLIDVDADYMAQAIDMYGKVALYGLYFDYDKASLTAESKPALEEIAKLLKNRPDLSLYVVGHTDMKGTLAYNLDLSLRRARSVTDVLVNEYGISRSRLEGQGVGPLVPVMSNRQDEGRAKNRRVELVER